MLLVTDMVHASAEGSASLSLHYTHVSFARCFSFFRQRRYVPPYRHIPSQRFARYAKVGAENSLANF